MTFPGDFVVTGSRREQQLQLGHPQSPALPVERPNPRSRLALNRRGGTLWMQLEQEVPVARAPLEAGLRVSAVGRPPQVVLARRHSAKLLGVGPRDGLLRLAWVLIEPFQRLRG